MIKLACQTYTWEMLGAAWLGSLGDILQEIAACKYDGVEISTKILADAIDDPEHVKKLLDEHGLELAALAFSRPSGFTQPLAATEDQTYADRALRFLKSFPGARLGFGGPSSAEPAAGFAERQVAYRLYRSVGERAEALGIRTNVHPHSHHGSLIESRQAYVELLANLSESPVALGPDTGHIVRGGQELLAAVTDFAPEIEHIHFKDVDQTGHDGRWVPLGQGVCDFEGVLRVLRQHEYAGWIVSEEESEAAREPSTRRRLLRENANYMRGLLDGD